MKKLMLGLFLTLSVTACDGGGGDSTCANCTTSFSQSDCTAFAQATGCTSGEPMQMACGGTTVQGCVLHGCPDGREPQCGQPMFGDAGHD